MTIDPQAEARDTKLNATIGIALDDDLSPTRLSSITDKVKLSPQDIFPYSPSFGKKELRVAWLREIKRKNPSFQGNTSLPIVTPGITHALSIAGYLFINLGDTIISPDKFWCSYKPIFEHDYGGKLYTFNTFKDGIFDLDAFEKKLRSTPTKKIIILFNFPNNPSGYTPTIPEAKQISGIIQNLANKGKKILVILDDAYLDHIYKKGIFQESLILKLPVNFFIPPKIPSAKRICFSKGN